MEKINLQEKFGKFSDHWHPRLLGELNGQHVKIAKLKGEFVWHHHEEEDELFLVIEGTLEIAFKDKSIQLEEGEMLIVPKGVVHKPIAHKEVKVLLFEPAGTVNTGDQTEERTRDRIEKI
ncbi:MAG: cupin domain-containing protein [Bacteroidota bacterium]|nr:mannose-6-phosphate isomerase [Christiangramia sp.]MEE2772172.1 cupin domain-containing protein [Bacteroidota bacterium]